ncbi:hypothetical protein LWI28_004744 [Acer negundo]|uniref:Uncharacterized protein n=1 Tax=Acer negundo TaxID=4023 RepID=A0AAD5IKL7_ACENE|nr:hypothetical protein LWI28_004744 [Acer negundo]KAK4835717.1 hypothetical protein QYF36_013564 [Acer negundo]
MGNCQAIDAAALVIQHPSGKLERLYWSVPASEIMRINPGHYVSLIIPLPVSGDQDDSNHDQKTVRFTRVKLLRPSDTLVLGHAYRLITSQEVMKVLRAKKYAKTKRQQQQQESVESLQSAAQDKQSSLAETEGVSGSGEENTFQATKHESHRPRTSSSSTNPAAMRSKSWRPSLQSISEAGS